MESQRANEAPNLGHRSTSLRRSAEITQVESRVLSHTPSDLRDI